MSSIMSTMSSMTWGDKDHVYGDTQHVRNTDRLAVDRMKLHITRRHHSKSLASRYFSCQIYICLWQYVNNEFQDVSNNF